MRTKNDARAPGGRAAGTPINATSLENPVRDLQERWAAAGGTGGRTALFPLANSGFLSGGIRGGGFLHTGKVATLLRYLLIPVLYIYNVALSRLESTY